MNKPTNLLDVYILYENYIKETHNIKRAKNILDETRSAIMRPLLVGLGYQEMMGTNKLSNAEVDAAKKFMKTQSLEKLKDARLAQQRGFKILQKSLKSETVYGSRLNQLLIWCESQSWWPGTPTTAILQKQCCPKPLRDKGLRKERKLTRRQGTYLAYKLPVEKTSPNLRAELEQFYRFLVEPEWPGRVIEHIEKSSADRYLKEIRLILGWFYHYQEIAPEELSLTLLIPKPLKSELGNINQKQKQRLWKNYQAQLEKWLCKYLKFLRENASSESPRTKLGKLLALSALGKFLYSEEVEDINDYRNVPVLKIISKYIHEISQEVEEWQRQKRYVSERDEKWPDPIPNKTVLTTIHEQIVEPLRQECRIRNKDGKPRLGKALVTALQRYLVWSFLAYMPARRQEEYRDLKIALTCPVQRPKEVSHDGLYHPLIPDSNRAKRYDGTIEDNYIYKTYIHQGKFYKQGIWILDIQDHKEWKVYGSQSIVIPNPKFNDGTCFYDHIERYLYGCWTPGGRTNQLIYDWWQPEFRGCRGRWVNAGRAEFNPSDFCCLQKSKDSENWLWGYFFLQPNVGVGLNGSEFAALVSTPAKRLIGKSITPHTLRSIWASWAYQMKLTDRTKESLAYSMGHSLKTLKEIYERCTPEEKRRPIEEAISHFFFLEMALEMESPLAAPNSKATNLVQQVKELTVEQRQSLLKMLEANDS